MNPATSIVTNEVSRQLNYFLDIVEKGTEIIVTREGKAVAKILPLSETEQKMEEKEAAWERSLARMKKGYHLGGGKFNRDSSHER